MQDGALRPSCSSNLCRLGDRRNVTTVTANWTVAESNITIMDRGSPQCVWVPVSRMLQAAEAQSQLSISRLRDLLTRSDGRLTPLCDPLLANVGLNRWLAKDREEAYSDWLAWMLNELKSPEAALEVLRIRDPELLRRIRGMSYHFEREYHIPLYGRLDLFCRFEEEALIAVEIKKTAADVADTDKQLDYCKWLKKQTARFKYAVLLAVGATNEDDCKGFEALRWEDVCIDLRRMLPGIRDRLGVVAAAMFVAFISAVESNLLGLVAPKEGKYGWSLLYARTADHIERSLETRDSETG